MPGKSISTATRQRIGVRSLLGVSLLLAGGLYLVAVLTSVVNQAPARVTCAPVTVIESESTADQVKNDTRSTKKLAQKFSQSKNAANRAALKQSAETRKRRLLTLFAGDPASARRQLLKPPERKKLEAVTSNCVETEVTVAGQLRVLHGEDFATHQPYEQFFITSGEKEYKLHGLTDVAAVEPGSTIQVEGFEIDGSILVAAPSPDTVQPTVQTTSQPPPALLNVPTPRKLLVLMGDYTNTDVRTPDYATVQTVLPKIADYYEENSYDLVTFEATSFDWFEMNLARGSTCDVYGVARELIRLVDPQVDFTQFNFADLAVIAPFPQFPSETNSPGCRWGGMSSVNPQTYTTADGNVRLTTVWIKAPTTAVDLEGVLDHELGHNIASYGHANHTWCVAGQTFYGPSCEQRDGNGNLVRGNFEYGDPYDIMGGWYYPTYRGYGIGHFNAARKAFAGWVRLEEIVTINSGDEGRTVTLVPLERDQSGTKLLKIQRTAYEYLTVQYRQPRLADGTLTYDDVFSSSFPAIFEGATVHTSAGSPTYLLDTTPNPDNDAADTVVRVGETFSDPLTGASIRVDSRTNDAITVTVTPPAIDFWPPASPVVVNDGPGADIDTTDDTTSLAANWEPVTDIGSGVDHYEYTVVWPSGELVPPTSSGLSASINLTGLNLQPGITYLVAVRAVDRYGNVGYYRFSDGLTVTTTRSPDPPLTVGSQPAAPDCVYDGPNFEDLEYSNQVQVLHAVWCESVDPVDYYQYAIGRTPGGTDVVGYTRAPETAWVSHPGLNLLEGQKYYVTVRGVGSSGVAGPSTSSNGVTIDVTPPASPQFVNDGLAGDEDVTASLSTLFGNWAAVSGLDGVQYHVGIGSAADLTDVHSYTLSTVTSATFDALPLVDGRSYFLTLRTADAAGNLGLVVSSDGIAVDVNSDPEPPSVAITSPADGATVAGTVLVRAAATDNRHVYGVQFYFDGQKFGSEDRLPPYAIQWNTALSAPAQHTLHAVARDARNQTTSSVATVTVNNTPGLDVEAPSVFLVSPTSQTTVSGIVTVWGLAIDNVGVTEVRYYLDGQQIGSPITQWPYRMDWNSASVLDGTYTITAEALDQAGNQGVASPVTVVVQNGRVPDYVSPNRVLNLVTL